MSVNPALLRAVVERLATPVLKRASEAAADKMRANLSGSRTGIKHARLLNTSSAPGEYPAKQSGDLYYSIDSRQIGFCLFGVGSWNAPPEAFKLEFDPPGFPGYPRSNSVGLRKWLSRTRDDPATAEAMKRAI